MAKIGRNDPCPCNSGKKYKKCCGATQLPTYTTDQVTKEIGDMYVAHFDMIRHRFGEGSRELALARDALVKDAPLDIEEGERRLEAFVASLEQSMRALLARHSPTFWLSLERRFPPWRHFPYIHALPGQELQFLREMRQVQTALFLKHGSWEQKDWRVASDLTLEITPEINDLADLLGYAEPYFCELATAAIVYRRLGKGGRLALHQDGHLEAVLDKDTERAARLYELRRAKLSFTFSPLGVPLAFHVVDAPSPEQFLDDYHSIFIMDYTSDANADFRLPGTHLTVKGPGFRSRMVLIKEVFEFLEPFEARVEEVTGLSLYEWRLAFVALKNYCIKLFNSGAAYTCVARGLVLSETQWMFERLCSELEELYAREGYVTKVENTVEKFLTLLACKPQQLQNYDVLFRRGCGCFLKQDAVSLLDLTLVLQPINDMLLDLQLDNEMRQIKGAHFEKIAAEHIRNDVPGLEFPIKPGLQLKRRSAGVFAEADLYISCGSSLVVVDCKAYSVTREYLKGQHKAVSRRWGLVQQWIMESDRRAKLIAETTDATNYEIPANVTRIIPVVCSAFPEYIANLEEKWHLNASGSPRVCTYPELVRFIRDVSDGEVWDRLFAIRIPSIEDQPPLLQDPLS